MDEELVVDAASAALQEERDALTARVAALEGDVAAGQARWQASVRQGAMTLALQQAGCRDIEAALRLPELEGVTVDDAGVVGGLPEALAALKQARGYLFTPRSQGGSANPAGGGLADPSVAFAAWLRGRE